jgi:hypothetical protein
MFYRRFVFLLFALFCFLCPIAKYSKIENKIAPPIKIKMKTFSGRKYQDNIKITPTTKVTKIPSKILFITCFFKDIILDLLQVLQDAPAFNAYSFPGKGHLYASDMNIHQVLIISQISTLLQVF